MKTTSSGWVVVNRKHPKVGKEIIVESSFSRTRSEAIKKFIEGTNATWETWVDKYNYEVVEANQTIYTK
jgi:hypothetical protein